MRGKEGAGEVKQGMRPERKKEREKEEEEEQEELDRLDSSACAAALRYAPLLCSAEMARGRATLRMRNTVRRCWSR